jgi:hypothetical protein
MISGGSIFFIEVSKLQGFEGFKVGKFKLGEDGATEEMMARSYRDLLVWQKARALANL